MRGTRSTPAAALSLVATGFCLVGAVGCSPSPLQPDLASPNPVAKMIAIEQSAHLENPDREALLRVIEQLDSEDPAVRLLAISVLERITGETHGYLHYAPRHERDVAIARWVAVYGAPEGEPDG